MMDFKTNKSLYDLISALAGVSDFQSNERGWLLSLCNRRLNEAYRQSSYWPRYLISAELRTIANQIIPFAQDGYYVFGAGTDAANGIYELNGTQNSAAAYTKYDTDGTTALYSLVYTGGTTWTLISGAPSSGGTVQYSNSNTANTAAASSATIAESGWTVVSGTASAPKVRDLSEIDEFLRIHRDQPFLNNSSLEYEYFLQFDGAHVKNVVSSTDRAIYVTYKKKQADLSTLDYDGASSTQEVPSEFFHYIAHAAYADYLRGDGQHQKALIEEDAAREYLNLELEKVDQIMSNNNVNNRFKTHGTQQNR